MSELNKEREVVVAQLGCGYWGPNLLRNFATQPNSRVKWLADLSESRRNFVSSQYPAVRTTPDWQEVFDDDEVDAIVVATPAATHYRLVKDALNRGKHVFVEKPLALTVVEADELVELAESTSAVLMAGHTFLYNPAIRYLKRLIDDDLVGDIFYYYCQRLNLGQVRSDVNAWWNLAPHDVSILLYLMGGELPVSVAANGMAYLQEGIEDVVFATLTWESGVTAQIQVSWLDPGKVRRMTVVGSKQMVVYDDVIDDKITILDKGFDRIPRIGDRMDYDGPNAYSLRQRAGDVWLPRVAMEEPLKVETGHFLDCVRSGEVPLTGPRHARDVVAVLEAGQRSLRDHGRVVEPQPVAAAVLARW